MQVIHTHAYTHTHNKRTMHVKLFPNGWTLGLLPVTFVNVHVDRMPKTTTVVT